MKKGSIFDRKTLLCAFFVLLLFTILAALIIRYAGQSSLKGYPEWRIKKERMLANKLRGVGLLRQSAKAYERYLEMSRPDPWERGKIAYTIAQLYMEDKAYEEALPWLYEVEMSDPETQLASKVNSLIITCLESLGRHQAAEYALKARTALDSDRQDDETKGGKIIAKIGQDTITLNQINQVLDELPPWIKKEFNDPEKKREFAKQYIAEELLYRKGLKLGYERDPQTRKKMEQFKRQWVINQVQKKEIEENLSIDETDVKNYFLAHQNDYLDPNQKDPPPFNAIKDRVMEDYKNIKMQQLFQNLINQMLSSTDVKLYLENVN